MEPTASIEAGLLGADVARDMNADAGQVIYDVLLRTLGRPEIRALNNVTQAHVGAAVGTMFKTLGAQLEEQFTTLAERLEEG